jgi:hypothetical protein
MPPLLVLVLAPGVLLRLTWRVRGGQLHALQRSKAADRLTPALLLRLRLLLLHILSWHLLLHTQVLLLLLPCWRGPHAVPSLRRHGRRALLP